jgi:hypothetical protein
MGSFMQFAGGVSYGFPLIKFGSSAFNLLGECLLHEVDVAEQEMRGGGCQADSSVLVTVNPHQIVFIVREV